MIRQLDNIYDGITRLPRWRFLTGRVTRYTGRPRKSTVKPHGTTEGHVRDASFFLSRFPCFLPQFSSPSPRDTPSAVRNGFPFGCQGNRGSRTLLPPPQAAILPAEGSAPHCLPTSTFYQYQSEPKHTDARGEAHEPCNPCVYWLPAMLNSISAFLTFQWGIFSFFFTHHSVIAVMNVTLCAVEKMHAQLVFCNFDLAVSLTAKLFR